MGTGHDKCVFIFCKADKALFFWVFFNGFLALFSTIIGSHSVDGFHFEWQAINLTNSKIELTIEGIVVDYSTYEDNLFNDMDAIDQTSSILLEGAVSHHSLLATAILIIDRDD